MKNILTILLLLLMPSIAYAVDPSVSGVTGTVADGESITIAGSNFGSTLPNVVIFDDFEAGTNDVTIPVGGSSEAKVGTWDSRFSYDSEYADYASEHKVSGNLSYHDDTDVAAAQLRSQLPAETSEFYGSWWMMTLDRWPGADADGLGGGWKTVWVWGPNVDGQSANTDIVLGTRPGQSWKFSGNSTSIYDPKWRFYYTSQTGIRPGVWHHVEAYVKGSTTTIATDGAVWMANMSAGGPFYISVDSSDMATKRTDWYYDVVLMNAWISSANSELGGSDVYFDDFYFATGPAARARVMIGNASVYEDATNLTILTPTAWAAAEITATVNEGSFSADEVAYLFVINSDGVASAGEEIVFGTTGTDETAPTVESTSPLDSAVDVAVDASVQITFDEGLTCGTVAASVSIDPDTMVSTAGCSGAIVTFANTGQSANTTYTVTMTSGITDDADTPNAYAGGSFSYTTLASSGSCSTDIDLCDNQTDCETEGYNWCGAETPPCKVAACDDSCSTANWYLCEDQSACETASMYWWEGACRTIAMPQNIYGANIITYPDATAQAWSGGTPAGFSTYYTATEHPLGVRLLGGAADPQEIYWPLAVVELTRYCYVVNIMPTLTGQLKIYRDDTDLYESTTGTKTQCFETPIEASITDHGLYFDALTGSDAIINHYGLFLESQYTRANIDPTGQAISIDPTGQAVSIGN